MKRSLWDIFCKVRQLFSLSPLLTPIDVILGQKAPKNSEKNDAKPEIENQNR